MQKQDVYKEVARNLDELIGDYLATGGSIGYIISPEMIFPNIDQVKGAEAFLYSGGGVGQTRVVASFNPTTDQIHVVPSLSTAPSSNTKYLLFRRFRKADFESAVDRAMGIARNLYFTSYQTTITLIATQYAYSVPSGMDFVAYLQLVPTSGTDYESTDEMKLVFELKQPLWRLEHNQIRFDPRRIDLGDYDKHPVAIIGQARPNTLGTDNATVPSQLEEYLINRASQLLASRRLGQGDDWNLKFAQFRKMADNLELYIQTQPRGEEVR